MPYQNPFRCPKVLFGPSRWQNPFLSLVGPLEILENLSLSSTDFMAIITHTAKLLKITK